MSWTSQVEAAIRSLRDVEGVSVEADGDEIRELHVVTSSQRPAKHIVRDVQSVLKTLFHRTIDYRVVSVAYVNDTRRLEAVGPRPAPRSSSEPVERPSEDRIRFSSVNLFVTGPRAQAQVELRWKGVTRVGGASGASSRDAAHRLIAAATVSAVQEFLDEDVALSVDGVETLRLGRADAVVVALGLHAHRQGKTLVGSCTVEQDPQQAVVLATLAALNRVVGGLRTKEPTEYILRPTST